MKPLADLHIHSVYSDGTCGVDEICAQAVKRGVRTIALSDHDTTGGLAPIQEAVDAVNRGAHRLTLIPAIELSSGENGLTHVLGYGMHPGAEPLESELATLKRIRMERNLETIRLMEKMLKRELLPEPALQTGGADPALGRMHVARLLMDQHVVRSVDEAFHKYLSVGKPAYLPLRHMSMEGAIDALRKSGAVPVLAHPVRIGALDGDPDRTIAYLKACGLMGLEVYHPSASRLDVKLLYHLAVKYKLLVTGGSDFHGDFGIRTQIGEYPSGWLTWEQDLDALRAAIDASAASHAKGDH